MIECSDNYSAKWVMITNLIGRRITGTHYQHVCQLSTGALVGLHSLLCPSSEHASLWRFVSSVNFKIVKLECGNFASFANSNLS